MFADLNEQKLLSLSEMTADRDSHFQKVTARVLARTVQDFIRRNCAADGSMSDDHALRMAAHLLGIGAALGWIRACDAFSDRDEPVVNDQLLTEQELALVRKETARPRL